MGNFVENYLTRYELAPDELNDVALKAQAMIALYDQVKSKGSESVTVRFRLRGPRGFAPNLTEAQRISAGAPNSDYHRATVPYGKMEGEILFSLEEIIKSESDPEYGRDFLASNTEAGVAGFAQKIVERMNAPAGGAQNETTVTFNSAAASPLPVYHLDFSANPWELAGLTNGDLVQVSASDGTSAAHATLANAGRIVDLDLDNGYAQIAPEGSTTPGNPGGWDDTGATAYYVYRIGEMHKASPSSTIIPWSTWNPSSRSTADLFGIDRSVHSSLSGNRLLSTDAAADAALTRRGRVLAAKIFTRVGGTDVQVGPKRSMVEKSLVALCNPEELESLEDEEQSRVMYKPERTVVNGFEAIFTQTQMGKLAYLPEPTQRRGTFRIVNPSQLHMVSITGQLINILSLGMGKGMLRAASGSNDMALRPFFFGAHVVGNPGAHAQHLTT
jgi:hypothetical protein